MDSPPVQFCAFTNGFGPFDRAPGGQLAIAEAAIEDNPENEPTPTARALTEDYLATHTFLEDEEIERASLIFNVSRKWRNGRTIKVGFINGPDWAREKVLEILKRWTKYANLELVLERNLSAAEVRVSLAPTGQSWSMMGNGALGVKSGPTMELGWYVNHPGRGVVLHEGGHMFGFPHEQFHPERDCEYNRQAVIASLSGPPNNWSLPMIEANVLRPPWGGDTFTPYDRDSIMHYAQPANWFLDPSCAVQANDSLSALDKLGAAQWYPKPELQNALEQALEILEGDLRRDLPPAGS